MKYQQLQLENINIPVFFYSFLVCKYIFALHLLRNSLLDWGRIIKSIYNRVSDYLPCNSNHNVVNHAIIIMEAFSNVNIVEKLLAKLQEVESSCRCTYNGVGGVIMWMKTRLESTKIVSNTITSE